MNGGAAFTRGDWVALGVIAAAVGLMGLPGITQGGLGWSDAPNHTFDGIFVLEFFKQRPIDHAREWAEQFYLRYPALGIIVYYPPGFALFEALVFLLLGVNILAARMSVVIFAVGAGWLMYALGRRWFDRWSGLLAALLLITCPHGFLWLNDVMLEWPATFWILACVWCYERDRRSTHAGWGIALGAALVMAYLTKQTAGFVLGVLIVHALVQRRERPIGHYLKGARVVSLGAAVAIIGAYHFGTKSYAALPAHLLAPTPDPWFYPWHMPEIVGWPLLPLAVLGVVTMLTRARGSAWTLLLLWFAAWAGFSSVISAKEPRYFFFALAPLAFAAPRFLLRGEGRYEPRLRWGVDSPRIVLLFAVVISQGAIARARDTGRLPRFDEAVRALAERPDADVVLVDALRDGQIVFDLYQNPDARGRLLPLRASKLLYARAAREKYDYEQFVQNESEIVKLLDQYGIRYILIESAYPRTPYADADPPPRKMLRHLLAGDSRFELLKAWPMRCGDRIWDDVELRLYRYPSAPARTTKRLKLSIPAMGKDVFVDLP